MAEEQAIPDHTRRVAAIITAGLPRIPKFNRPFVIDAIARNLHAAELRGRKMQREADARICDDIGENGGNDGYFDWPAQCATAIRSQS